MRKIKSSLSCFLIVCFSLTSACSNSNIKGSRDLFTHHQVEYINKEESSQPRNNEYYEKNYSFPNPVSITTQTILSVALLSAAVIGAVAVGSLAKND